MVRPSRRRLAAALATLLIAAACSDRSTSGEGIIVDVAATSTPFDRRLLGTNAPAWIPPERLRDPEFQQELTNLGTTVLRMPGGSWSDGYDWLACETADSTDCFATWAARPSDFLELLDATDIAGMWTVSFNGTAQEAAALVAFFNGDVDDERVIGLDRTGRDWGTVGRWASLRAEHGHPDPRPIRLWEVGNETYGAVPSAGDGCAPWGWEEVWTCDPEEYVNGSDDGRDGYLEFREAMRAVDPDILVGAVGIGGPQSEWNAWGQTVIDLTGAALDFYVVHSYGFDTTPSADEVLGRAREMWTTELSHARQVLDARNPSRTAPVPIAVTEYNLVSSLDADRDGMMAEAINALFIAETIGEMASAGAAIANHWNLVNGANEFGGDYGVFEPESNEPNPQYYAIAMWSRMGDAMLPIAEDLPRDRSLSVYSGIGNDRIIRLLVINKTGEPIEEFVRLTGTSESYSVNADVARAPSLDSATMTFNNVAGVTDLDNQPAAVIGPMGPDGLAYAFAPYSITMLEFVPNGTAEE